MPWHASLQLDYALEQGRSVARHQHSGPLRILQSLYPEGDAVCHNVLVHPPGGLTAGDVVDRRDVCFSATACHDALGLSSTLTSTLLPLDVHHQILVLRMSLPIRQ